ncbi:uncharacterized protein LOC135086306 [Ostrinia nubilalis]|uniref:uncharacterized protein LOC135086306 n=1 Tax=Ostrinia nubilalis TaxID=29057 RepID=UPI003082695E
MSSTLVNVGSPDWTPIYFAEDCRPLPNLPAQENIKKKRGISKSRKSAQNLDKKLKMASTSFVKVKHEKEGRQLIKIKIFDLTTSPEAIEDDSRDGDPSIPSTGPGVCTWSFEPDKVCQTSSGWESRSDGDANFGALRRCVVHWRCLSGGACLEEQHPEELELLQQGSELGGESGFGLRDGAGADAGEEVPSGASSENAQSNVVKVESEGKDSPPKGPYEAGNVKQVLLATALINTESRNGNNYMLRALLDQGSQGNFVTESAVNDLKLRKTPIHGKILGVGGDKGLVSKAKVTIKVKSRLDPNWSVTVNAYVLKSITSFLPSRKIDQLDYSEFQGIELADPEYNRPNKIDILLGAEVFSQIIQEGIRKGSNGTLLAQSTSLGWILSGTVKLPNYQNAETLSLHCQLQESDELLKKFWELENSMNLTKEQKYTEEERKCEEFYVKTTTRDKEGRYIVKLPFKTENPECKRGETRSIAVQRLKGLEKRFEKDNKFKESYKAVINEYLEMGHMFEVLEPDLEREESVYLPHHAVVREDKDTTKLRVVSNASQVRKNGVSLNENLMVGPTIQPDLRHLVMKWRLSYICLTADIVKMYRQIKVHEDDTNFQRLVWRNNPNEAIKDFKLVRVTFGTASAPFLVVRTLQQVAKDEGLNYPLAVDKVRENFYMDDMMSGCESVAEGIELYTQMKSLLNKAGFRLQKWASNDEELLKMIKSRENEQENGKEKEECKDGITIKMDEVIKFLGLTWERHSDHFRYKVDLPELLPPITKRKIIADISRLFDPLGWVTPCIIIAKVLIQKLWIAGIDWDDEAPSKILQEWCTYREDLKSISEVKIPRWLGTRLNDVKRELHGFCDASKVAYAAVVYIRTIDAEGNIHVSLVTAKSKVAPIKQVSIPRLELCGAVELTRLMLETSKVLNIEHTNLHAWTDSTIVLAWLNSLPSRWKVFVANRVSEILTNLNPNQWSHVSTQENPADYASRGVTPSELKNKSLWLNGPEFLITKTINYKKPTELTTEIEAIKVHNITTEEDFFERFSKLRKLIRVTAYRRRFLQMKKPKSERKDNEYLTTKEMEKALEVCIIRDQKIKFEEEIEAIKRIFQLKTIH